jgi:asparagine synthase (glutamine-hydrolysing)
MFRYFGFHWNPDNPAEASSAQRLEESMGRATCWQRVLSSTGMRVYTIGHRPGVNGFYALPNDQGVVLGRLFRRRNGLSEPADHSVSSSEGRQILKTEGRALVDNYWGRYVAVLPSDLRGACLLRDPSGALPCFLAHVEGVAVFFSWLEDLFAFAPDAPAPRASPGAIAVVTLLGHVGGSRTALEGISQVLPGQLTPLARNGHGPMSLWSVVDIAEQRVEWEHDIAAGAVRRVVMDCVRAWSSCYDAILLRLSGGLDSAILLGSLTASPTGARLTCLNYFSAGSDTDERGFARLAASRASVDLIERERNAEFRLEEILVASRMPTPATYIGRMDASRIDAEVAACRGARVMFSGAGGDQVFFQRRCTWPAADYLSAHGFGRGFVGASLDAARLGKVSLWRSMRSALVDRRRAGDDSWGIGQFFKLVRRDALDRLCDADLYRHPDLQRARQLPIGKYNHVRDLIDPPGYYDPYLPAAAPELLNPLLSQPLVELCLTLPTWLLSHGGRSRALERQAFANDIPREIVNRQSKGGMDEHTATVLHRNLPLARALLLDGHLVREGLLDRNKVEAALAGRLAGLDTHVNEIHHYIAIEAWLRRIAESPTH